MSILRLAVQQRLHFDESPDYLHYLLEEALDKLAGDSCKLRKSEFFALFQEATMRYIDLPTQMLIRQAVQLEPCTSQAALYMPIIAQDDISCND